MKRWMHHLLDGFYSLGKGMASISLSGTPIEKPKTLTDEEAFEADKRAIQSDWDTVMRDWDTVYRRHHEK